MSKRLLLLNLVLATAAVVFAVQITRILLASPQLPAAPSPTAPPVERTPAAEPARAVRPLGTYDVVAARNLFNPSRSETATVAASPAGKPLLYGIVLKDGAPRAFLEDPVTKKVIGYRTGDQVAGGLLERIEADRVVIRRGEERFEVLLKDPTKPRSATATVQPSVPLLQIPLPGGGLQPQPPPPPPAAQPPASNLFRRPQAPAPVPTRTAPSP